MKAHIEKSPAKRRKSETKSAYAAQKLREALADGRFSRGEWLRAQGLAEELGLSLTPVREALLELAKEGLIDMVPFRGARVAEIPMVNLSEVYLLRALLESAATGLAAARMSESDLAGLHKIHEQFKAAVKRGDAAQQRELNDAFHFAIYDAAGAPLMRQLIKNVWARAPRDTFALLAERAQRSIREHTRVLEALGRRDPKEAEFAMRHHVDEAFALILEYRTEPPRGNKKRPRSKAS